MNPFRLLSTQARVSFGASLLTVFTAGVLIAQWFYSLHRSNSYVQVLPNIALSATFLFFIAGLALGALELGKKRTSRVLSFFVCCLSFLDFTDQNLGFGIDFDQIISLVFCSTRVRHFYQLAPNTAVAFFCSGMAIFLLSRFERKEFSTFVANVLGGFSIALGTVSLFGYSIGVVPAYSWRGYWGMALYSAVLFVILGFGISIHALNRVSLKRQRVHVPMLLALSMVAIVLQLYRAQSIEEIKAVQETSSERMGSLANQIRFNLDEHAFSLMHMGKRWNGVNEEYATDLRGFSEIRWHSGFTGSSAEVQPHETGLWIIVPVQKNAKSAGALIGIIRFDRLVQDRYDFSDYALSIHWKNESWFRSGTSPVEASWTKSMILNYRGVDLELEVTPYPHQIKKYQSRLPTILLLLGILFAWALGYGAYLFILTRENEKMSQDRLAWEQAISTGSDLIFVTVDRRGIVQSFNPAAERFFEYQAEEIIQRRTPVVWLDSNELRARMIQISKKTGRIPSKVEALMTRTHDGAVERDEWTFITKSGGKKKGELSIHVLKGKRGELVGYVGIIRDVTEQRHAEEKLVQSSKMASLGEMAAGVAHEINNPLTIIQGRAMRLLQLAQRPEGIPLDVLVESLHLVIDTSRRIAKIVKGLATFSRNAESDAMEPSDLNQILENTFELCRERFQSSRIRLEVKDIPQVVITCRPTQISQVILNLLNNAFDAVRELDEKWIRVDVVFPDAGRIHIRVTDGGAGIAKEIADKMMEPFFTTKGVGKGTGLGLSISKGIVEGHGGKLFLSSVDGHTSFVVDLPLSK